MAERLFRAYLTEGLNIGDRATLDRLAAEAGVRPSPGGAEELRAELTRVRSLGIRSVPVFRFDGGALVAGAQSEETFRNVLAAATAADR